MNICCMTVYISSVALNLLLRDGLSWSLEEPSDAVEEFAAFAEEIE